MVAAKPSDHYRFLSDFTGADEVFASGSGLAVKTPRGEIQAMHPAAFERQFGEAPRDTGGAAQLAGLRFAVRDPGAVQIGSQAAMGATLVFEAAA
jgi:hypothetical protein